VVENSNVPVRQKLLYNYSVMRWKWNKIQCAVTRELNNISKTAFLQGIK
jgi:ActR/RegA family two-component response regulator